LRGVVLRDLVGAHMRGDQQVIDFLNKALRHELAAVNQYWLHYRILANWGYKGFAKTWREESIEEMRHADKLVARILFLDGQAEHAISRSAADRQERQGNHRLRSGG